jgi:hypothetical protein
MPEKRPIMAILGAIPTRRIGKRSFFSAKAARKSKIWRAREAEKRGKMGFFGARNWSFVAVFFCDFFVIFL